MVYFLDDQYDVCHERHLIGDLLLCGARNAFTRQISNGGEVFLRMRCAEI